MKVLTVISTAMLGASSARAITKVAREGNLDSSQTVSSPSLAWRAFACMVPFTASDGTALLMLYGGTNNTDAGDPLQVASNGESGLHVFDVNNNQWYVPNTANAPDNGPVLPGCGSGQGDVWVYDPHYGTTDQQSSPVSLLDSVHWSWSSPTEGGQLPVSRFGAAFAYVSTNKQFYMHGGIPLSDNTNKADNPPGIANNLDILSPSGLSWAYASNGPARKYHSLCYISSIDSIVLFGGSDQNIASYNDVKTFSVKSNTWQYSLKITGDMPSERVLHSAVCTNDSMIVFGGTYKVGDAPSDSTVWVLTASGETTFAWSAAPISTSNQKIGPTARAGHSATLYDNNMYIYGGIGPNTQDSIMYKLDIDKWMWSQTNVTGLSTEVQKEQKTKTAVLIAAIVSSILGILTIGITATVIYRLVRRRYGVLIRTGRRNSEAQSDVSDDDEGEYNTVMAGVGNDNGGKQRRGTGNSSYFNHDSGAYGGAGVYHAGAIHDQEKAAHSAESIVYEPEAGAIAGGSVSMTTPVNSAGAIGTNKSSVISRMPMYHTEESNGESAATTPASIGTERELLPVLATNSNPGSPSSRMLNTMRAHARSFSTRLASSRLSTAFSDTSAAPTSGTIGRKKRAGTSSTVARPRRRSTNANRRSVVNMYGRDQVRLENEYRHAEAINEILLSGQPIPTWLRDAVNQAQGQGDRQPAENTTNHIPEQLHFDSANESNGSASGGGPSHMFKVVNSSNK
ncbi:hypothetical protein GGI25_000224 [Coemansia spiralis]|uniref:Galactose oxidase n=2 Tax=Coemansia TaxID=4863 RepID=A0A9W8GF70_9FUNG|nr:hypothetical protein BX070DRAFT_236176 [Coemansia spiralis]KAJ1995901.1 hypothetical protein EDC05_000561 [Coemansia umbellata]KAJ2625797.1 hypothetical protein GGI26_000258 [Coemansia sp. RSA 1358]KAJ2680920.1 hypothetical protein GGI25_000224 [Coemansia spiralis]